MGSNTGVFVGNSWDEYLNACDANGIMPENSQYFARIVSFKLNLKGPTMTVDTACASSLSALTEAVTAMRKGLCDSAIVAGVNIGLKPLSQLGFKFLGMLSPEGKCKCLDESADGYAKGEACAALLLQRRLIATNDKIT